MRWVAMSIGHDPNTPGVTDLIRDRQDRLLEEQQKQVEALRAAVWDGVSYEESVPAEEVFDRLLERYSTWDTHKGAE